MKWQLLAVGIVAVAGTSCRGLNFAKRGSGTVGTPYEDVPNGGYSTGDFSGDTNPYGGGNSYAGASGAAGGAGGAAGVDSGPQYAPAYAGGGESYDRVSVIPFTDNGSGGGSVERADPPPTVAKRSAGLATSSRASTGASSGRAAASSRSKRTVSARKRTVHVVKRGDTLTRLSRVYDVPVSSIRQRNDLNSDLIRVGEKLVIR